MHIIMIETLNKMIINCDLFYMNSFLISLTSNVFFAFIIILGLQKFRYWYKLKRHFHRQTFHTFWKRYPKDVIHTVSCEVKGNKIIFRGNRIGSKDIFEGQFIINPINLKFGEGFHNHTLSDGFAFLKIIIKDNDTFFVESPYTGVKEDDKRKKGFVVHQAFVWKKVKKE
jgi:hypothetical protein